MKQFAAILVRSACQMGMIATILALPLQGREDPAWTVDGLVRQALKNNAELSFYEAEVAAARGQRTQAGLWKNPEFSGEYGGRRIKDSSGRLQDEGTTRRFSLTQTFEFPGKGSLRKAVAAREVERAELGLRQFRRALEGKVRLLALRYEVAAGHAAAAHEISTRGTALVTLLRERPAAGAQQFLEMRLIEASLLEIQQAAKESARMKEDVRLELNTLLGLPSSSLLEIRTGLVPPRLREPNLDRLILAGLDHYLPLKMREVELEQAGEKARAARLDAAPDFVVGPFFSQDEAGEREENLGVSVSVEVPLWNWNQGNIATADARRGQAEALIHDARARVQTEIARRFRAFELNRMHQEQIPADAVTRMKEAADFADRQYRTGAINVRLYLDIQSEYLKTHRIARETLLELWENWLDLELLTGGSFGKPEADPASPMPKQPARRRSP